LSERPAVGAPPPASSIRAPAGGRRGRSYFVDLNEELSDKGFLVTAADDLVTWAAHRVADVDDLTGSPAARSR